MNQTALTKKEESWRPVYQLGAAAALIAVIVFRRHLSAELTVANGFGLFEVPDPLPVDALDWFMLMQRDKLVGLALLDVFDLVNYLLVGFVFLALYVALRKKDEIVTGAATLFSLIGITVYFCSNQAFAMLFLSEQYVAAPTEAKRRMLLSAGEALLANHHGTGVTISLFLVLLAGLLVSIVMLTIIEHIQPGDVTVFHGAAQPEKLNFIEKWILGQHCGPGR